jgi:hypothetical protein
MLLVMRTFLRSLLLHVVTACLAGTPFLAVAQEPAKEEIKTTTVVASPSPVETKCCVQLKALTKLALPPEKAELKLDETSPVHNFGQGGQPFLLIELPPFLKAYEVHLSNLPQPPKQRGSAEFTRLAMRIETLDADFSPVRTYLHSGMKKRAMGYEKTVFINPGNQSERYLLIYGALNLEPERVTVSKTDVVFVGTGFFIGGTDQAITLQAADYGVVVVEAKGLPVVTK